MPILTRFPHLFLLVSSHRVTELTHSQFYPHAKGKVTKPYCLREVAVSGDVTLWAPEVSSMLFPGASLPLCAIKESGRHLVQSVCKVHCCNKCHSAGIQTGWCSTAVLEHSHQCAKDLEFINASKIELGIFQQKLPWQNTGCGAAGDTSDLLWPAELFFFL